MTVVSDVYVELYFCLALSGIWTLDLLSNLISSIYALIKFQYIFKIRYVLNNIVNIDPDFDLTLLYNRAFRNMNKSVIDKTTINHMVTVLG